MPTMTAKRKKNPAAVAMARLRAKRMTRKEREESARKAGLASGIRRREIAEERREKESQDSD